MTNESTYIEVGIFVTGLVIQGGIILWTRARKDAEFRTQSKLEYQQLNDDSIERFEANKLSVKDVNIRVDNLDRDLRQLVGALHESNVALATIVERTANTAETNKRIEAKLDKLIDSNQK